MTVTHGLDLGAVDLATGAMSDDNYMLTVYADGATLGSSQAVVSEIISMLADGNHVRYDRAGNRVVEFDVAVEGTDGRALQAGEVALRQELYRPNTVTWTPPAKLSEPTVYEVLTSEMRPKFDDLDEQENRRVFTLTLTCSPFARSATLTTVEALEVWGASSAVVDDCSTGTGWTGTRSGATTTVAVNFWDPSSVGIGELTPEVEAPETWTLTRAGAVDFTGSPYLVVKARTTALVPNLVAYVGTDTTSSPLTLLAVRDIGDSHEYTYLTGGGPTSSLTFAHRSSAGAPWQVLVIHEISKTGLPPAFTPRQLTRIIPVGGTERTPGSIHVQSANGTDYLGVTVVHTSPEDGSGYSPPLRRWRVSGGTVSNGGPFSGSREAIGPTSFSAKVPTSALPEGGYQMVAILRCPTTTTQTVNWDIWTIPPGGAARMGNFTGKVSVAFTANVWAMVVLAEDVTLPTVRTGAGLVEVFIGAGSGIELDEAWLFRVDDGCALTYITNRNPTPNLWLDSPDVGTQVPRVSVGVDRASAFHPGIDLASMGTHILHPEGTATFTASSESDYPKVTGEFYRRWPHNAGD